MLAQHPLAELHLHLYGCIRASDYLEFVRGRAVDWAWYLDGYERVYGVRPDVQGLVARHARGDPEAAREFRRLFVFGDEDAGDFRRFQTKFNLLLAPSAFLRSPSQEYVASALEAELGFFVERILADQRAQGLAYAEQRILLGSDLDRELARPLLEGILRRYLRSSAEGLTARLALSLPREDPWPSWELAQELALGPFGEAFSAIDFCFVEEGHPPSEQVELFRSVHAFNDAHPERALAILYHVGESFADKSLESAVRWVEESAQQGAHRLGHAIALGIAPEGLGPHERSEPVSERRDQIRYDLRHAQALRRRGVPVDEASLRRELDALAPRRDDEPIPHVYHERRLRELRARQELAMQHVARSGAVVEVCPTSNLRIGNIRDPEWHPVHRFCENGVPFVVASDDPGIFDTTLRDELDWVLDQTDLGPDAAPELRARTWNARSEVLSGREQHHRHRLLPAR